MMARSRSCWIQTNCKQRLDSIPATDVSVENLLVLW